MCKSCQDHESNLKEALDELSSAHTLIDILQNELLTHKSSTNEQHSKPKPGEWATTT